jgi:hypothetical protein
MIRNHSKQMLQLKLPLLSAGFAIPLFTATFTSDAQNWLN